jgi:peptide/nickel transport system substrate-binding protein
MQNHGLAILKSSSRLVAAVVLLLCSCTRVPSADGQATGRHPWTVPDTLRMATGIVPRTLNPLLSSETSELAIDRLFDDLLVTVDEHGRFVPDLAADVPSTANGGISSDGRTIRYRLRRHVRWQDGQPFTSADVKFTYEAIMNPRNDVVSRHGYDVVARVDTPDAYTVVFHLKHRFAPFVATVFGESDGPFCILPAHLLARRASINDGPYNALPIGTGPFRVVRWLRGNRIELVRNDDYFLGRPKLKSIVISFVPDENAEIVQLRTHEIDWAFQVSVNAYRSLRSMPADEVRSVLTPFNGYEAIIFNAAHGPTSDVRIRRAITYALDKRALVDKLAFGAAQPATEDLPPFLWAYDTTLRSTPYDVGTARQLLAAAGYGPARRLALQLYFEQSEATNRSLGVQIQSLLAPLGIDVTLHPQLSSIYYASYAQHGTLERGAFDLALNRWMSGVDPDDSAQFTCSNLPPNGVNPPHFCDPAMDEAQTIALDTYGESGRKPAYVRIQRILEREAPQDFLWWPKQIQAISPDLRGFAPNPVTETWNAWTWSI